MKLGKAGLDLIKQWEGYHRELANGDCRAYPDVGSADGKPYTIGWGTTRYQSSGLAKYGRNHVNLSDTLTKAEAELELQAEIRTIEAKLASEKFVTKLTQNQYDALVSFCYNTGFPAPQMRRLREGKFDEFKSFLLLYVKGANGKELPGLVRRRKAERELWDKGDNAVRTDQALLKRTGRTYGAEWAGIEEIVLQLGDKSWRVASGVPGRQTFRKAEDPNSIPGSLEPIPQGVYHFGPIEWAGGKGNWNASFGSAFGPIWQDLKNGQPMRRGAFGIHMDGNMPTSPGSAGCVVWYVKSELAEWVEEFEKHKPIKLIVDWGL
jgi:GH24 family phage-related lysozyme (muramidase)